VHNPTAPGAQISIGEILLWQAKFRRNFAALIGLVALSFKWTGVISAESLLSREVGLSTSLVIALVALAAYLAFIELTRWRVRTVGHAGRPLLYAVLVSDYVVIFGFLVAVTPPAQYARGLIITIFMVQFARMYFGLRATVVSVVAAAVGYAALIVTATQAGMLTDPQEQFWNLAIFLMGALLLGGLHGQVSGRVERVLSLFDRAQEGDFSTGYDESLDRMPDPITMIGRAYNRMRLRLESIVLTDALSGCFNRRGFDQLCTREVSRAVRGKHPMSMLAIDVDHFKRVNDEFGHLTGDEVLREMGARLRETARAGDVVARIGGEEFEILAPDTNAAGAQILADRIHAAFRGKPFASLGGVREVSISIGIASAVAENDQVVAALIARADEALYVAKRNGRNRSQMWEPGLRAFDGALPGRRSIEVHALKVDDIVEAPTKPI
jgi:diguanylate cyclase (GGDEF)-like protein